MLKRTIAAFALLGLIACSDASLAKIGGNGARHKVTLYSGGQPVAQWISTGRVQNEEKSDGFYFNDEKTGHLIRVAGSVVIERM